jgi:hypothetical protein
MTVRNINKKSSLSLSPKYFFVRFRALGHSFLFCNVNKMDVRIEHNGISCKDAESLPDQEEGVSFWTAMHAGEIIARADEGGGVVDVGADLNGIHGWSPSDFQSDLAGCLARLPEGVRSALFTLEMPTLEELIHKFFDPSADDQEQTQPEWLLRMVAERRMIRLRVFTEDVNSLWSVKDYPEDASGSTVAGLPWVVVVFTESSKTWRTL